MSRFCLVIGNQSLERERERDRGVGKGSTFGGRRNRNFVAWLGWRERKKKMMFRRGNCSALTRSLKKVVVIKEGKKNLFDMLLHSVSEKLTKWELLQGVDKHILEFCCFFGGGGRGSYPKIQGIFEVTAKQGGGGGKVSQCWQPCSLCNFPHILPTVNLTETRLCDDVCFRK